MTQPAIERGDIVRHKPTGEDWVIKHTGSDHNGDWVEPAGWPSCRARASDCTLIEKGAGLNLLNSSSQVSNL